MEAATAEKPAEKTRAVTFLTNRPNLRVTIEAEHKAIRNERGEVAPAIPGLHAQFDGLYFTSDDPRVIDHLRNHNLFGDQIWEEGAHPNEPKPTVAEQMKAITGAAVRKDPLVIGQVIDNEKATHNREVVLLAAKEALQEIEAGE